MNSRREKEGAQPETKLSGYKGRKPRKAETDPAFVARLEKITALAGGQNALARAANISIGAVQGYLTGSEPSRRIILQLCKSVGVRVEWLVSGEGEMQIQSEPAHPTNQPLAATDHRLIGRLTEKIMNLYKDMGFTIALHQVAERAAIEHDRIVAAIADPDDRLIQIGEVIAELRHELRAKAADPTSSKRQA